MSAMNNSIHFQSRVGDDGVLNVQLNLGQAEAKKEVKITIEPVSSSAEQQPEAMSWSEFVERTYGSCDGLGLERPEQGSFELREPIA
jgi:hypothetical protein